MFLSHVFRTYFEGNKNDSPGPDQILKTPLGSEKYSLITVFYAKVKVECVSKWITLQLSLSLPPSFFFFPLFLAFILILDV